MYIFKYIFTLLRSEVMVLEDFHANKVINK